jgi:hypothetical protein
MLTALAAVATASVVNLEARVRTYSLYCAVLIIYNVIA